MNQYFDTMTYSEVSEELSKVSMMARESTDKIKRLKEEENQIKKQLGLLEEEQTSICRSLKQLEQENKQLDYEFNNLQLEINNIEKLQNIYDDLLKQKLSSNDLKKLEEARKKLRTYQSLLGIKWDFVRMKEDPELISGIVYNKISGNLNVVSTYATDFSQSDIVDNIWNEIENLSVCSNT